MAGPSVTQNLKNLRAKVAEASKAAAREPASVQVLAVSKLHSLNAIREAYDCGQRDFAENYVQEALEKIEQLDSLPVRWHFIGRIQSNKVKFLGGGKFAVIHSIDRRSVAEALNKVVPAGKRQDIFLQYNVADEATKGGASEADLKDLVEFTIRSCASLRVLGLMVMPPLDDRAREHFRHARLVLEDLRKQYAGGGEHPLDQLSMGTTADFADAIAEGSTWIRIGTEIFGPREEKA